MGRATTVRSGKIGKNDLRLAEKDGLFYGFINQVQMLMGENADDVWRKLHDEVGKSHANYIGFDGAHNRFKKFFPAGFDIHYSSQEREYKLEAKRKLEKGAPLLKALTGTGLGEIVLSAYRATNMLSPFEKVRMQDVLRGEYADQFIQAAARFTINVDQSSLTDMEKALKPYDNAKWTVVTYLPFLWQPDTHMFLKPTVTKNFAERVGHSFSTDYKTALTTSTYESLLSLVSQTRNQISDLKPYDNIDIQSFIWTATEYLDSDAAT